MRNFNLRSVNGVARTGSMEQLTLTASDYTLAALERYTVGLEQLPFLKNKTTIALEDLGYSAEGFLDSVSAVLRNIWEFIKDLFKSSPTKTETATVTATVDKIKTANKSTSSAPKPKPTSSGNPTIDAIASNAALMNFYGTLAGGLSYSYIKHVNMNFSKAENLFADLWKAAAKVAAELIDLGDDVAKTFASGSRDLRPLWGGETTRLQLVGAMQKHLNLKAIQEEYIPNVPDIPTTAELHMMFFTNFEIDPNKMAKEVYEEYKKHPTAAADLIKKVIANLEDLEHVMQHIDIDRTIDKLDKTFKSIGDDNTADLQATLRKDLVASSRTLSLVIVIYTKYIKKMNKAYSALADIMIAENA